MHFRHCDDSELLPKYQSAYGRYYSCETSLLKLRNNILWNIEDKLVTVVTILDLSATFDTMDHDLLLEVLYNKFGIDGHVLKWYSSYLKLRKFTVNINGAYSTEKTMQISIPKGSVQGAFLFIAYASTLQKVITDLTRNGLADNHLLRKPLVHTKPMMKTTQSKSLRN